MSIVAAPATAPIAPAVALMIWAMELPPSPVAGTTMTIGGCVGPVEEGGGVLQTAPFPQAPCFEDECPEKEKASINKAIPIPTREPPTANKVDR